MCRLQHIIVSYINYCYLSKKYFGWSHNLACQGNKDHKYGVCCWWRRRWFATLVLSWQIPYQILYGICIIHIITMSY